MTQENGPITVQKKKRKLHIDFLKIVSMYMVMFNHTNANGFALFTVATGSALYPLYLFNAVFIKIAVPVFFMASGALLLKKNESFGVLMKKRFLRIAVVLFAGSLTAYLYEHLRIHPSPMSVKGFFTELYTSNISDQFWYLYVYLAYILMLPLLRRLAQAMKGRDFLWLTVCFGIYRSLYLIDFLLFKGAATHNSNFNLFINFTYVFYPLIGYFIEERLTEKHLKYRYFFLMLLISFVAISVTCLETHYRCTLINEWSESQPLIEALIFIPAITAFYGAKLWFYRHEPGKYASGILSTLASATFGIYSIEQICRYETKPLFNLLKPYLHTLPACWVWIAAAFFAGFVVIYLIKKIPFIRKFL